MFKAILTFVVLFMFSFTIQAQTINISGSVNDPNENKPIPNAVVALLTVKDSVLTKFTRTDNDGKFVLTNVTPGKYIMMKTHPYFADLLEDIDLTKTAELPLSGLLSKAKLLQEIIVKTGNPIKIKGDTTVYTADSFKVSANANVEELLKKLPGIQVDKNGEIKAMGEKVEKVLVDGEEFFGDDPGMAVKNLRADAVKEVQVFDKKSDQAEFTGIDDGKTQKTINLKLKDDKKKGHFGKIDLAGGPIKTLDPRYNTNLLYSSFKGKRKITGFVLNGNTGQDGLSWQDEQKYGGQDDNMTMSMDDDGGVMFMWRGNSSDDEPYFDPQNGYITNLNAGAQYSNKWNDKKTLNFSPKFNSQKYENLRQTFSQTQIGDSALIENSTQQTNIDRYNVKLRGIYDIKIDTNNTLKITANSNLYHTESDEVRDAVNRGSSGTLKNTSNRNLSINSDKQALTGNIIFKHRFPKLRRTLSFTADLNSLNTDGLNKLRSFNQSYFEGVPTAIQQLDQMKDYNTSTKNLSSKIAYTEPINKKYSFEIGYQLAYNYGNNSQYTYSFSPDTKKYDVTVDSLSNEFKQNIIQHIPSAKISYTGKKMKFNFGSGVGVTDFELKDLTYDKLYERNFTNFFPSAAFNYTYKANHNIRFNYNGNTTQPTINQLQPLRNNNDYYNQYIGNPDLKPSFTNSFNLSHNSYNFIKDFWMYQSINVREVSNSITNNRIINVDSGKTTTQPINTNGNISVSLWSGIGYKFKKIDTRINVNPQFQYNKYADVINGQKSFAKIINPGISIWASKSKDKKYDISLQEEFNYNSCKTSQSPKPIRYNTNTVSIYATVYYKKVWSIISDYQYYTRQKTAQFDKSLNNQLWNARLQRTFKNNEFTVYTSVRDILNQNIGIQRNFFSNTYTEEINNRLKRYFLLGFTWDFKNKNETKK
ncbi:MAG: outer membrane beta-barrel family protein [Ginsengibacter sp.]